jgi:hypothetical protein
MTISSLDYDYFSPKLPTRPPVFELGVGALRFIKLLLLILPKEVLLLKQGRMPGLKQCTWRLRLGCTWKE